MSGIPAQRTQDACVVEGQGADPIADRSRELLGSSDRSIMAMRRLLLRAAQDLKQGIEPENAQHPENYATRALEAVSPYTDVDQVLAEHQKFVATR
jgi:hypothetical protein